MLQNKDFDYNIGYHSDMRNYSTGIKLMSSVIEKRSLSPSALAETRAEEMQYNRFLESNLVTDNGILNSIIGKTKELALECSHVLSIQDTSELSFSSQTYKKANFGPTGNKYGSGYFVHPSLVVNPETEEILGYGDIKIWKRQENHGMYILPDFIQKYKSQSDSLLVNLTSDAVILEPKVEKDGYSVYFIRNNKLIKTKDVIKSICYFGEVKQSELIEENISSQNVNLLKKLRKDGDIKRTKNNDYIENKESYKWTSASQNTSKNLKGVNKITHVSDRESDDYAYMSEIIQTPNNYFVLRVRHDRKTSDGDLISKVISKSKVNSTYELELQRTPKRDARIAQVKMKFGKVEIAKPEALKSYNKQLEKIMLNYVDVEEVSNDYGKPHEKIKWRLFTNHEINSEIDAYNILRMYILRWLIEMIFTILKSKGFDLENNQLEDYDKTVKLTLIGFNAALSVFYLSNASKYDGIVKIRRLFSEKEIALLHILCKKHEGKTEKLKNKFEPETLKWANWIITRLGGWKGYNSRGKPGIIAINKGLQKFYLMYEGWSLAA